MKRIPKAPYSSSAGVFLSEVSGRQRSTRQARLPKAKRGLRRRAESEAAQISCLSPEEPDAPELRASPAAPWAAAALWVVAVPEVAVAGLAVAPVAEVPVARVPGSPGVPPALGPQASCLREPQMRSVVEEAPAGWRPAPPPMQAVCLRSQEPAAVTVA